MTEITNSHVEQDHVIFFADNAIHSARDYFVAVSANKFHSRALEQATYPEGSVTAVPASDKEFPEAARHVPLPRTGN